MCPSTTSSLDNRRVTASWTGQAVGFCYSNALGAAAVPISDESGKAVGTVEIRHGLRKVCLLRAG